MTDLTIRVRGLRELARGFHRVSGELADELDTGLLEGAKLVEREAHQMIRARGLVGGARSTGRLDRLTKAFIRRKTGVAGVRSGAMRGDFSYPRRYEFQRAGARAFLFPALERSRPAVLSRLERLLDDLARGFNEGGTTR